MCYIYVVRFEWDPRKAQINQRKHEVTFGEAAECFADSLAIILTDHRHPDRLILIGVDLRIGRVPSDLHRLRREGRRRDPHHQRAQGDPSRKEDL